MQWRLGLSVLLPFITMVAIAPRLAAAVSQADFSHGDRDRILEVALAEGGILQNGLMVYQVGDHWYLPLSEMAVALEIAVKDLPNLVGADGFILEESRTFSLKLPDCKLKISGKEIPYACDQVLAFEQDIYVESEILSQWYPAKFEIQPFKSQVLVYAREKLPVQQRMEREGKTKGKGLGGEAYDPGYPRKKLGGETFNGPSLDQQVGWTYSHSPKGAERVGEFDSAAGWGMLGLDGYAHASGTSDRMNPYRLTLGKKDPDGNIFGILHATEIQGFDVDMPALPLVTSGALRRGLVISSAPLGQSSTFSSQDFQGNLLPGWEVELYQNEIFIDRQTPDEKGRYSFKDIPLVYGLNQFRLAFYGPFGRTRNEFYTYQIGASLQKPGKQIYRGAFAVDGGAPVYTFETDRGISDHLTASIGSSRLLLQNLNERATYGWVGLNGYTDSLFLNTSTAFSNQGGHAYEGSARVPWRGLTVGTKYTLLSHFKSDVFNGRKGGIEEVSEWTSDTNFSIPIKPSVMMAFDFKRATFIDDSVENTLRNRTAFNLGEVYLHNLVSYNFESPDTPVIGEFGSLYSISGDRLKTGLGYDTKTLEFIESEYQFQISKNYSIGVLGRKRLDFELWQFSSNLSRSFKDFALRANVAYSTDRIFSTGISLTTSLAPDPDRSQIHFSPESQVSSGAARVSVFVDDNRNGLREPEEKGLPEATLITSQTSDEYKADENGFAYIDQLQAYQPVDLSVSGRSIQDPMLKSALPGYRFFPRPGQATEILFPIVYGGLVDGMVQASSGGALEPVRGAEVVLLPIEEKDLPAPQTEVLKAKTDRDGFYSFEGVAPGSYRITLGASPTMGSHASPQERKIAIPPHGAFISSQDFTIVR